jgi:hypothetical protein
LASYSLLDYATNSNFIKVNRKIDKKNFDVKHMCMKCWQTTQKMNFLIKFGNISFILTYFPNLGSCRFRTYLLQLLYRSFSHRVTFLSIYFKSPNIRIFFKFGGRGNIYVPYSPTKHAISIYFIPVDRGLNTKNFDV